MLCVSEYEFMSVYECETLSYVLWCVFVCTIEIIESLWKSAAQKDMNVHDNDKNNVNNNDIESTTTIAMATTTATEYSTHCVSINENAI